MPEPPAPSSPSPSPSPPRSAVSAAPSKPRDGWSLRRKPFSFPSSTLQIAKKKRKVASSWTRTRYFDVRQEKLVAQAPAPATSVLRGTVIYFTGVKSHSQRKLESLVWRNGGVVDKVWRRRTVTHIVADNLAASKLEKEIRANPTDRAVIVTPQWIFSSLENGEPLPTWDFRVVKGQPGVKDVASFFKSGKGANQRARVEKDSKDTHDAT